MIDELNPDSNAPVAGSRIEAASGDSPNIAAMAIPFDELKKNPNFENVMKVNYFHNLQILSASSATVERCLAFLVIC